MDRKSCSISISVCECSSGSVIVTDAKCEETSDSVSKHVLSEEESEHKHQQVTESVLRTGLDGVLSCSNTTLTNHVHKEVEAESNDDDNAVSSKKAKAKEEFHVVDMSEYEQRICRICHFGSDQTPDRVSGKSVCSELIEIGCNCKNELGLAHIHCAEAWFKLRGNSVCEICGCAAKNVTVRLMVEEERSEGRDNPLYEGSRRRRGNGQSCCIFMVFLLTIILLHYFFKKISSYYENP
ncbi:unnamed protein product [Cochlearia groenlandica]